MTKIEQYLQDCKVSFYKSSALMGLNPAQNSFNIKQKLTGKLPMKKEELNTFYSKLEAFTKKKIPSEVKESFEVDLVLIRTK